MTHQMILRQGLVHHITRKELAIFAESKGIDINRGMWCYTGMPPGYDTVIQLDPAFKLKKVNPALVRTKRDRGYYPPSHNKKGK